VALELLYSVVSIIFEILMEFNLVLITINTGRYDHGPPPPGFFGGPPPPGPYFDNFPQNPSHRRGGRKLLESPRLLSKNQQAPISKNSSNFAPTRSSAGATRRDDGPPGVSLLVRNVSPDISPQDLQMAFGRIGEVRDVYIPRDFHSHQPKGFAFIEYATAEMAREARDEMDKFLMRGRELEVVYAQEKRKTPNEMRGRVVDGEEVGGGRNRGENNFQR